MNNNRYASKAVFVFAVSLLMLTACGDAKPVSSDEVIRQFKETAVDVKSIDFVVDANMKGDDGGDAIDVAVGVAAKIDRREGVDRKMDFNLKVDGGLATSGKEINGSLDFIVRTLGDRYFFKVSKLESDDGSLDKHREMIEGYKGKWLHLASDFVPSSFKQWQKKDDEALSREKKLKDLFVETNLFEANKDFGIESLNGQKVYHYGIRINEGGLRDYIRKAAQIDGKEMSDAEVEQSAAFAKSVDNLEFWIGVKDFYLYKGVLSLVRGGGEGEPKSNLSLSYVGRNYDADLRIDEPEKYEEFNPIALIMQLQLLNPPEEMAPAKDGEATEEGAESEPETSNQPQGAN